MKTTFVAALWSSIVLLLAALPAGAQSTNADFKQAVATYQQSHSYADAEKVIKMAASMEQLPPIPEEARKHFVQGTALFKEAKSPEDFKQVIDEFKQTIRLAPWWSDARYNYALALEAAGHYANAIINLKLYQLFKLPEAEARAVQDKIWALEAKAEKTAKDKELAAKKAVEEKQAMQEDAGAKKAREQEDWLKKLDGARYSYSFSVDDGTTITWALEIKGKTLIRTTNAFTAGEYEEYGRYEIPAREFVQNSKYVKETFRISETAITVTSVSNDGSTPTQVYYVYSRER